MNTSIILAAITIVVVYGNDCSSTYNISRAAVRLQYNKFIHCSTEMCNESKTRFSNVADLTTNQLRFMINNEAFKFVSLEIYIIASHTTFHLIFIFSQKTKHLQSSNFETIMANFTPVCQRYTDVMAHKYYLQHLLFNGTNNATATVLINLTSVIIKLQVMANSLQTIQVYACVYSYILVHIIKCAYCRWKMMEIPV